jgi:hypothetical protein
MEGAHSSVCHSQCTMLQVAAMMGTHSNCSLDSAAQSVGVVYGAAKASALPQCCTIIT